MSFQKAKDPDVEAKRLERLERLNKIVAKLQDPAAFQRRREDDKEVGWAEHLKAVETEELTKSEKEKEPLNTRQMSDTASFDLPVGPLQTIIGWLKP
jgi:hypothetical protein